MKNHLFAVSRTSVLALFCSLQGFSGAALAGVYELEIRGIDVAGGISGCQELLARGAASFAASSGATVLGSECQKDGDLSQMTARIVYSAAERIIPWSTHRYRYSNIGFFARPESCEASLAAEIDVMRQMTGLEPFLAYCYKVSELGQPRYSTRLEAVGSSSVLKLETTTLLDHRLQNPSAVAATLGEKARQLGLYPMSAYSGVISSMEGFAIAFYAAAEPHDHPRLNSERSRYFATLADCERASAAFSVYASEPWDGITACSAAHPTVGFQLNLIWWDTSLSGAARVQSMLIPGDYPSVDACTAAAANVVPQLRGDGTHVLGSVCGRSQSSTSPVKLEIFTRAAR